MTDDPPVIIAHLILWTYTSSYGDLAVEAAENDMVAPDLEIDELMKHGVIHPPRAEGSPELSSAEGELFVPDDNEWVPETLQAKMYLLASKYDLEELKKKAVLEIEVMLTELDFDKTYFLPLVGELFGFGVGKVDDDKDPERNSNDSGNCNGIYSPSNTVPVAVEGDSGDTKPPTPASSLAPIPVFSKKQVLSPTADAKLWTILADEASSEFSRYQFDPVFQKVMMNHPQFNWEVSTRLQKKFAEIQQQIAKKDAVISGFESKEVKPKKGRKRKEKEMSTS